MTTTNTKNNSYEEFNYFQQAFYTNTHNFQNITDYELRKHSFVLVNNLMKGFPHLADLLFRTNCINFTAVTCPAIIRALHFKFMNNTVNFRMPQFIYFKGKSVRKDKVSKVKETVKGLEFSSDIIQQIKSILQMDSKSYEYLKYTEQVQNLGKQLTGDFIEKEKEILKRKSRKTC